MSAEKNNDKKEQINAGGCCAGMAEMMRGCCPNGPTSSDCCSWMEEMGEKLWNPQKSDSANENKKGS